MSKVPSALMVQKGKRKHAIDCEVHDHPALDCSCGLWKQVRKELLHPTE